MNYSIETTTTHYIHGTTISSRTRQYFWKMEIFLLFLSNIQCFYYYYYYSLFNYNKKVKFLVKYRLCKTCKNTKNSGISKYIGRFCNKISVRLYYRYIKTCWNSVLYSYSPLGYCYLSLNYVGMYTCLLFTLFIEMQHLITSMRWRRH